MPRKMLLCWINNLRPVGRRSPDLPRCTSKNYKAIKSDDTCGKVQDWFPLAKKKKSRKKYVRV